MWTKDIYPLASKDSMMNSLCVDICSNSPKRKDKAIPTGAGNGQFSRMARKILGRRYHLFPPSKKEVESVSSALQIFGKFPHAISVMSENLGIEREALGVGRAVKLAKWYSNAAVAESFWGICKFSELAEAVTPKFIGLAQELYEYRGSYVLIGARNDSRIIEERIITAIADCIVKFEHSPKEASCIMDSFSSAISGNRRTNKEDVIKEMIKEIASAENPESAESKANSIASSCHYKSREYDGEGRW